MEQDANAGPCKPLFDTLLFSLLAVCLIFALALIYQVFNHLQRISRAAGWATTSQSKQVLVDRHSTLHSSPYEDAEVALVGVWMSEDLNPKLIHRVALSAIDNKTLEQFTDKGGYLYVFSDPELAGAP